MPEPLHPVPVCTQLEGRQQCPLDMNTADPALEAATEGSLAGAIVRFVAGYKPTQHIFSRTSRSYQVFSGLELSWMHAAGSNAAEILTLIANQLPEVASFAWGPDEAARLRQESYARSVVDAYPSGFQPENMDWLLAGWHAINARGDVQALIANWYFANLVAPVIKWMQDPWGEAGLGAVNNLSGRRTLATGVRAKNTSNTQFNRLKELVAELGEVDGTSAFISEYKGGKYADELNNWPEFQGQVTQWPSSADLGWSSSSLAPSTMAGGLQRFTSSAGARTLAYIGAGLGLAALIGLGIYLSRR